MLKGHKMAQFVVLCRCYCCYLELDIFPRNIAVTCERGGFGPSRKDLKQFPVT